MNNILDWLLEDNNAAIRYRTMTELLEKSFEDNEVNNIYDKIWEQKEVMKILSQLNENGVWVNDKKYYGEHTSMRYLTACAEFGLHKDERIDKAAEHAIEFLIEKENADMQHDYSGCSNALVLRALVMLGYHNNLELKRLLNKYTKTQLYDGGFICERFINKKPERKSCYKASVAGLLLYAECNRKGITFDNVNNLCNYFLKRDVFYSSDKNKLIPDGRDGWRGIDNFFPVESMRIGLPLIMSALSILGVGNHPAMKKGWEFLESKKSEDGKLILEGTLTKQPCSFGKVGKYNKWVTFYGILAEKNRKLNHEITIINIMEVDNSW